MCETLAQTAGSRGGPLQARVARQLPKYPTPEQGSLDQTVSEDFLISCRPDPRPLLPTARGALPGLLGSDPSPSLSLASCVLRLAGARTRKLHAYGRPVGHACIKTINDMGESLFKSGRVRTGGQKNKNDRSPGTSRLAAGGLLTDQAYPPSRP